MSGIGQVYHTHWVSPWHVKASKQFSHIFYQQGMIVHDPVPVHRHAELLETKSVLVACKLYTAPRPTSKHSYVKQVCKNDI